MQEASQAWLQAKQATNELMGKVELLFRPYLRWLDRSMERLFTEGARQVRAAVWCPLRHLDAHTFKAALNHYVPVRFVERWFFQGG